MNALLEKVLAAHGGMERWANIELLTAQVTAAGPFWIAKGWPEESLELAVDAAPHEQHAVLRPFTAPDRVLEFGAQPERVGIRTAAGEEIEGRSQPRESFADLSIDSSWNDPLRIGYFLSYAMWNYLTTPFVFTYPGVETEEIEPWEEDARNTWRRLRVTFPGTLAEHSPQQVFYFDDDGLLRRNDYFVRVNGDANVAHYVDQHRTFGGLVFPTRRRVHRRLPDNTADLSSAPITFDVHEVTVTDRS